jgi:hypothetical protein
MMYREKKIIIIIQRDIIFVFITAARCYKIIINYICIILGKARNVITATTTTTTTTAKNAYY